MSRKGRRAGKKRSYTGIVIIVLVVITALVGYFIFTQSGAGGGSPLINQPVDPAVANQLSGVSLNTLGAVGSGPAGVTATKPISNPTPLLSGSKPEVLYMGSEYCPFCAAERWSMIVALDKFGNFTGLKYMQSAPAPELYPSISTFTFSGATYTSNYIAFVSIEQLDRNHNPLQTATANETSLLTLYDTAQSIPFLDLGNVYSLTGSQFSPVNLRVGGQASGAPYNWTQISSQLDNSSSPIAQSVDGAANRLISAICKIDGGQPSSVCSQGFAQIAGFERRSNGSQVQISDLVFRGTPSASAFSRFAPNRQIAQL
jgi:hypothetical protein